MLHFEFLNATKSIIVTRHGTSTNPTKPRFCGDPMRRPLRYGSKVNFVYVIPKTVCQARHTVFSLILNYPQKPIHKSLVKVAIIPTFGRRFLFHTQSNKFLVKFFQFQIGIAVSFNILIFRRGGYENFIPVKGDFIIKLPFPFMI